MSSQARFCLLQDLFFRHNLLDYFHWLESLKKFWFSSRCTFSRLHMEKMIIWTTSIAYRHFSRSISITGKFILSTEFMVWIVLVGILDEILGVIVTHFSLDRTSASKTLFGQESYRVIVQVFASYTAQAIPHVPFENSLSRLPDIAHAEYSPSHLEYHDIRERLRLPVSVDSSNKFSPTPILRPL